MTDNESVQNEIEFISGSTNILLVAPHGYLGDDDNTGELTRLVAEQSGCYAIINEFYQKPEDEVNQEEINSKSDADADVDANHRIDLNNLVQVKKHLQKEFLNPLLEYKNEIVKEHGSSWVFWIHGAEQSSIKKDAKGRDDINPDEIKVLVGYGQKTANDKFTAEPETAPQLIEALTQNDLKAVAANPDIPKGTKSFCGHDRNNMNQLFRAGEYMDPNVQSFQLEFRKLGCRDTAKNIEDTAPKLVKAISTLLPAVVVEAKPVMDDVVDEKVEKAYEKIALIFSKNYEQALMEVGQYIVRTFYGGENDIENKPYDENFEYAPKTIENARNNDSPLNDSLHRLYAKISDEKTRNTPSQAWVYNAVNLVIQWHDVKKELKNDFYTYRNLLLSHKISLLTVKKIQEKLALIQEVSEKNFTAVSFKERIADSFAKKKNPPSLSALLKKPQEIVKDDFLNDIFLPALKTKRRNALTSMKTIAEEQSQQVEDEIKDLEESIKKQKQYLKGYNKVKSKIEKAIEYKDKAPKKKSAKAKPKSEKSDSPSP